MKILVWPIVIFFLQIISSRWKLMMIIRTTTIFIVIEIIKIMLLSVCQCVRPSIHTSIYLSIHLSIHPSNLIFSWQHPGRPRGQSCRITRPALAAAVASAAAQSFDRSRGGGQARGGVLRAAGESGGYTADAEAEQRGRCSASRGQPGRWKWVVFGKGVS